MTSLVLGNDVIPRTSFKALCLLRDDILDCICRAKGNKTSILSTMASILDVDQVLYEEGQEPDSQFKQSLLQFKVCLKSSVMCCG
ncbi:hypothetical protein EON65_31275 [archaeon]|nr:MAG: hypothetical protein EON65_31275 [archaeon]